jgi:Flp pilus assembly pilin Flp
MVSSHKEKPQSEQNPSREACSSCIKTQVSLARKNLDPFPRAMLLAVPTKKGYKYQTLFVGYVVQVPSESRRCMWTLLKRLWRQQSGHDSSEYALLVAMIALIVLAAIYSFGHSTSNSLSSAANSVSSGSSSGAGGGQGGSGSAGGSGSSQSGGGGTGGSGSSGGAGGSGGSGGGSGGSGGSVPTQPVSPPK